MSKNIFFTIFLFSIVPTSLSAKEFGRIGLSSYYSDERFKRPGPEGENNDFLSFAGRFYYRRDQMTKYDQDFQTDLRALYDAYGKMDRERQQLYEEKGYELRQLALTRDRERDSGWSIGRFSSAGPDFDAVDGLEYGHKLGSEWALGAGLGLAPSLTGEDHLILDQRSRRAYSWMQWRPWQADVDRAFYNQWGVSTQEFDGKNDSFEIQQVNTLHWGGGAHYVYHLAHYQTVPRGYLGHWGLLYHWETKKNWDIEAQLGTHEQERIFRSERERFELPTARISSAQFETGLRFAGNQRLSIMGRLEKRHADNGWANAQSLNWVAPELWSTHLEPIFRIGFDNDYEKKNYYGLWEISWYDRHLELYWQEKIAEEHYDSGSLLRPITSEIGGTLLYFATFAPTFSFQHQVNANVEIFQALLRFNYHFGEDRRPPGPTHAPVRGGATL